MARAKRTESKEVTDAIRVLQQVSLDELTEVQAGNVVKLGVELIQKDYWADVRGVTQELIERIKDGEIKDEEGLNEATHEAVDGTQRVIYTFEAKLGMLATDNPDAWEEFGFEHPTVEQMMYCAMEADVIAQLESEGARDLFNADEEEED